MALKDAETRISGEEASARDCRVRGSSRWRWDEKVDELAGRKGGARPRDRSKVETVGNKKNEKKKRDQETRIGGRLEEEEREVREQKG